MSEPTVFGPEATAQIAKTVREVARQMKNEAPIRGRWQTPASPFRTVVLDAAIAAATNALTTPTTGTASVLGRNSDGDLYDTTTNITVVNRYEHITLDQYTLAVVTWIDGEWRLTSADCDALGDWP